MATEYKLWHVTAGAGGMPGGYQAGLDPISDWLNQTAQTGWSLHSIVPLGGGPLGGGNQFVAVLQREV
ncbi:MAG TPA: hypothetical protein VFK89_07550 [Actinomycetota bacterium]|nr:hypothetical protein [Actinomycetota bacterium]